MSNNGSTEWQWKGFTELAAAELYEMLALRQRVFVVEQNCAYLDADGLDLAAWHLYGRDKSTKALHAYIRVLPPGLKYRETSLGRVLTAPEARGRGFAKAAMHEALRRIVLEYGASQAIRISAQSYLEKFYSDFGFRRTGEAYLEDGIPHIEMLL